MKPLRSVLALLYFGLATVLAHAAEEPSSLTLEALFRPGGATHIAISPDGRYVAYTVAGVDLLKLAIVDLDRDTPAIVRDINPTDYAKDIGERSNPRMSALGEWMPFVTSLQWIDGRQLVYGRKVRAGVGESYYSDLRIIAADGSNDHKIADMDDVADVTIASQRPRTPRFLTVVPGQPGKFILEARVVASTSECYTYDLATGKLRRIPTDSDFLNDERLIFDWEGRGRLIQTRKTPRDESVYFKIKGIGSRDRWENFDAWLGVDSKVRFEHPDSIFFGSRSIPLGFDRNPDLLYFASNQGRDTFGIYALDLRTKKPTAFKVEDAGIDLFNFNEDYLDTGARGSDGIISPLIFDREQKLVGIRGPGVPSRTQWLERKLATVQSQLEVRFPGRGIELVDWDLSIHRVVAVITGPDDPGRFIVFEDGSPPRLTNITQRTPWLPTEKLHRAGTFSFRNDEGAKLTGTLTLPREPRVKNPPMVVLFPDLPGWRDEGNFNRQAQALAQCGFVVVKLNYRGIAGLGRAHRDAAKEGMDRIPLSDVRATITWLEGQKIAFDRKRVALLGEGYGAFLALRALELFPTEFATAVSYGAPLDLNRWVTAAESLSERGNRPRYEIAQRRFFFGTERDQLNAISLQRQAATITKPAFIIEPSSGPWVTDGRKTVSQLNAKGIAAEFAELKVAMPPFEGPKLITAQGSQPIEPVFHYTYPYLGNFPSRATNWTYRNSPEIQKAINDFLTAQLYEFDVKVGKEKVVEDPKR